MHVEHLLIVAAAGQPFALAKALQHVRSGIACPRPSSSGRAATVTAEFGSTRSRSSASALSALPARLHRCPKPGTSTGASSTRCGFCGTLPNHVLVQPRAASHSRSLRHPLFERLAQAPFRSSPRSRTTLRSLFSVIGVSYVVITETRLPMLPMNSLRTSTCGPYGRFSSLRACSSTRLHVPGSRRTPGRRCRTHPPSFRFIVM